MTLKRIHKVFFILILMLCVGICVLAEQIVEVRPTGQITVTGQVMPKDVCTVTIFNPDYIESGLVLPEPEGVQYQTEVTADLGGLYTFSFNMRGDAATGTYTARVKPQGGDLQTSTFSYVSLADKLIVVEQINDAKSYQELESIIEDNREVLILIYTKDLAINKTPLYQKYFDYISSGNEVADSVEAAELYNLYSVLEAFNQSKLEWLSSNGYLARLDITKLDTREIYQEMYISGILNGNGIKAINNGVLNKDFETLNDLYKEFDKQCLLNAVMNNSKSGYGHIRELIYTYSETYTDMGLDVSKYKNLSDTDKNKLGSTFMGLTLTETNFVHEFNALVRPSSSNNGGGSGAGGSSGGNGGITSSVTLPKPETPSDNTKPSREIFKDLQDVPWAVESIAKLAELEIVQGNGESLFLPNSSVTREEFIKMIILAFNIPLTKMDISFSDVNKNEWYNIYVTAAVETGLAKGQGDGTFGIGENVTREDMAVLAYRAAMYAGKAFSNGTLNFADKDEIEEYSAEAVGAMAGCGIINGVGDNMFAPKEFSTRAQAAKIIYGLITYQR